MCVYLLSCGDVRVGVRCFGGDSERSVVLRQSGAKFCDAGDGGVLGAGDESNQGVFKLANSPFSYNRTKNKNMKLL